MEGKAALVTGGAQGLGKGFTNILLQHGAKVSVCRKPGGKYINFFLLFIFLLFPCTRFCDFEIAYEGWLFFLIQFVPKPYRRLPFLLFLLCGYVEAEPLGTSTNVVSKQSSAWKKENYNITTGLVGYR